MKRLKEIKDPRRDKSDPHADWYVLCVGSIIAAVLFVVLPLFMNG